MPKNLEDRTQAKKTARLIDRIIESMFSNDASGYHLIDEKVVKSEGVKRIFSLLDRLDEDRRDVVEDEARYRLGEFDRFSHLPASQRRDILELAREKRISIEQAYKEKRSGNV